jgi:hypothetical protein
VHVLLLVVRFAIFDIDDYFVLATFQMARPTLYVARHAISFIGNCDVHV